MINEILAKLPRATSIRLNTEVTFCDNPQERYGYISGILITVLEFGLISWDEYDILCDHYISVLRGNAQ